MVRLLHVALAGALLFGGADACTNLLVSPGASADKSTIYAYNADSGSLYGSIGLYPKMSHPPNASREIWDWDDSVFLGVIPEATETFNVVGNANEHGMVMGETTFGGLPELDSHGTGGIMDYGDLIWIALQRTKRCVDAIKLIDALVQEHGYASDGESFSCVDGNEAWLMELIGKGKFEKGAVWVAQKVPDGAILAHANQARTTTFDQNDPDNVMFSPDVVNFARKIGRYPADASDADFDFSAAYDPVTFSGARHGEARVWDIYRLLLGKTDEAAGKEFEEKYLDYVRGYDLTSGRMPLFLHPPEGSAKFSLTVADAMSLMGTRLEGTWFDNRGIDRPDVGAGSGHSAYRWRPLIWKDTKGDEFVNERTVATQQTSWNFVSASRPWLPPAIRAIQWWAPDDSATSLRVPVYGGITRVPYHFADSVGQLPGAAVSPKDAPKADALNPSWDSAFWIWNLVSNLCYGERAQLVTEALREEMGPLQRDLLDKSVAFEAKVVQEYELAIDESNAAKKKSIAEKATAFCEHEGETAFYKWRHVFMKLFALTRDGFTISKGTTPQCVPGGTKVGCTHRLLPDVAETGYDAGWRDRMASVGEGADRKKAPGGSSCGDECGRLEEHKRLRMNKRRKTKWEAIQSS